jgi:hypothetical protein
MLIACVLLLSAHTISGKTLQPQPFAVVFSAGELNDAIKRGDRHIEIREHLDLSVINLDRDAEYMFTPKPTTLSIRVRQAAFHCQQIRSDRTSCWE